MVSSGIDPIENTDDASLFLKYENGSLGVINYFSKGNKAYSKERVEIYQSGKNIIIDNFKKIEFFGYKQKGFKRNQDKGQSNQFQKWTKLITSGGEELIPFESIYNTSFASIQAINSMKQNQWVDL